MSWQRIAIGVGAALVSGISIVIGKLWGASEEREAHKHLHEENEHLRAQREQLLTFFEGRGYQYEKIVVDIYKVKPKNKAELTELLKQYSLSDKEIERVNAMLNETNFYVVRAA